MKRAWITVLIAVGIVLAVAPAGCGQRKTPEDDAQKRGASQSGSPQLWGPTRTVTADPTEEYSLGAPDAVFDPVVGTVMAWSHVQDVEVQIKPVGKDWDDVETLEGADTEFTDGVMVGTDGDGATTVAWVRGTDDQAAQHPYAIVTATRSPQGKWSEPAALWERPWLDNMESEPVLDPQLAVGPQGVAVLAWGEDALLDPRDEESVFTQQWVAYRPAGGDWQEPTKVGARDETVDDVVIDADGVATVVIGGKTLSLLRSTDGTWREDATFGRGSAALATSGETIDMMFQTFPEPIKVQATHRDDDGHWSEPESVIPEDASPTRAGESTYYNNPSVVAHDDSATMVLASWFGPVQAVIREPDGSYGPAATISPPGRISRDVLGVWANEAGQALAVWGPYGQGNGAWVLQASYRDGVEGRWGRPVPLSMGRSVGEDGFRQYHGVGVVVYPSGSVLTVWTDTRQIVARELGQLP